MDYVFHPSAHWLFAVWSLIVLVLGMVIRWVAWRIRAGGFKTVKRQIRIDHPDERPARIEWVQRRPYRIVKVTFASGLVQHYQVAMDAETAFKWNP